MLVGCNVSCCHKRSLVQWSLSVTCCAHAATNRWPCYWGKRRWSLGPWSSQLFLSGRWDRVLQICLSMIWRVSFGGMICLADKTHVSHVATWPGDLLKKAENLWHFNDHLPSLPSYKLGTSTYQATPYSLVDKRFFLRFDLLHVKANCVKHHPFPIWHSLNPWEDQAQSRQGKLMGTGVPQVVGCVCWMSNGNFARWLKEKWCIYSVCSSCPGVDLSFEWSYFLVLIRSSVMSWFSDVPSCQLVVEFQVACWWLGRFSQTWIHDRTWNFWGDLFDLCCCLYIKSNLNPL